MGSFIPKKYDKAYRLYATKKCFPYEDSLAPSNFGHGQ